MTKVYETSGEIGGGKYTMQVFGRGGSCRVLWNPPPAVGTRLVVPGSDLPEDDDDYYPPKDVTVSGVFAGGVLLCVDSRGYEEGYFPADLREPAPAA